MHWLAPTTSGQSLMHTALRRRRDPLANSYVSSVAEDPAADPRLAVEEVPRTAEEDEEFGIAYLRAHGEEGVTHAAAGELAERCSQAFTVAEQQHSNDLHWIPTCYRRK